MCCTYRLVIAFALGVLPCRAQLGETMDQCIAKYGQPVSSIAAPLGLNGQGFTFKKDGYVRRIIFLKGIAGFENIFKEDESELSDTEIGAILQANLTGGKWGKPEQLGSKGVMNWIREDGAMAVYEPSKHCLGLMSKQYQDATQSSTDK